MKRLRMTIDGAREMGTRSIQQDDYGVSDPKRYAERGTMAVLSDGIGGLQAGEAFSRLAVEEMLAVHSTDDPGRDPCERLADAYRAAVGRAMALMQSEQLEGGATVAAVLIQGDRCAFLSVGDSRIYLLRGGGLIQLNREQTLGHKLDERAALGLTLREEAQRNRYRSALVNNLCEREAPPWDSCPRPFVLQTGDRLALMSDGVFKTLTEDEIAQALMLDHAGGARALIDAVRACALPRQDNYSAVVIAMDGVLEDEAEEGCDERRYTD